jgi:centrosomal protein CEP104
MVVNYIVASRFKVIFASSEDADYPASQLNEVNPNTKGWMSTRFCSFPQELGFALLDGESKITQIQLLSHQNKISSKVEIFIGKGATYETASFKRLGYMSLDSNERSNYQARELKTVFIDHVGSFLRLVINENHKNKHNTFNQVGIVAVSLLGVPLLDGESNQVSPRLVAGNARIQAKNPYNDLTVDINLDPQTANKLRQLADAKSRAIQDEDYLTAKQIKNVEQELKTLGSRLAQLDMAKAEAVAAEDYDLAKDIKDECDNLRLEIEQKVRKHDLVTCFCN